MFFCLRVDLDYVPWDSPDAHDFGHGEPAALIRLLELARSRGLKLHCFASERNLRAFPSAADAVLNDGHDLDWLCKRPLEWVARFERASESFRRVGAAPRGLACPVAWPEVSLTGFEFLSAPLGPAPVRLFPVETRSDREASRAGMTARSWADAIKMKMREASSQQRDITVVVRPQVLAKFDPRLATVRDLTEFALSLDFKIRTLREALDSA